MTFMKANPIRYPRSKDRRTFFRTARRLLFWLILLPTVVLWVSARVVVAPGEEFKISTAQVVYGLVFADEKFLSDLKSGKIIYGGHRPPTNPFDPLRVLRIEIPLNR